MTIKTDNVVSALRRLYVTRPREWRAYVVGGAVRDYILGIDPHDLDIVVEGAPTRAAVHAWVHKARGSVGVAKAEPWAARSCKTGARDLVMGVSVDAWRAEETTPRLALAGTRARSDVAWAVSQFHLWYERGWASFNADGKYDQIVDYGVLHAVRTCTVELAAPELGPEPGAVLGRALDKAWRLGWQIGWELTVAGRAWLGEDSANADRVAAWLTKRGRSARASQVLSAFGC